MTAPDPRPESSPANRGARLRLAVLAVFLTGLFVAGKATGWTESLDIERVRSLVARTGALGYVVYAAIFAGGELIHVPGIVFVAAGVLAFGRVAGFFAALGSAVISVSTTFVIVRSVGGRALSSVKRPIVRRILSHLDEHPLRTVILLRLVFWLAPPVNYALALSNVRFRDYVVGSFIGLVLPLALIAAFLERVLAFLTNAALP